MPDQETTCRPTAGDTRSRADALHRAQGQALRISIGLGLTARVGVAACGGCKGGGCREHVSAPAVSLGRHIGGSRRTPVCSCGSRDVIPALSTCSADDGTSHGAREPRSADGSSHGGGTGEWLGLGASGERHFEFKPLGTATSAHARHGTTSGSSQGGYAFGLGSSGERLFDFEPLRAATAHAAHGSTAASATASPSGRYSREHAFPTPYEDIRGIVYVYLYSSPCEEARAKAR